MQRRHWRAPEGGDTVPAMRMFLAAAVLALTAPVRAAEPLTVFAAASLAEIMDELGADYTRASGQPVRFSYAASGVIARQLAAGAKADLLVTADRATMDAAVAAGQVRGDSARVLAGNRLVLVTPAARPVRVLLRQGAPLPLAAGERLAIGDPAYVPAGKYAQAALTALGTWDAVKERLARADNVRAALGYVARGDAPLGIVYATDARAEPRVRVAAVFPAATHPPIVYMAGLTTSASAGADRFLAYVQSAAAKRRWAARGFTAKPR